MELEVLDIKGEKTGRTVKLPDNIFGIEPSQHAVYLDIKRYLAALRQGTAKTKERGEVVGSTRKIKKQKGTGTARAGSIKNPIFVGGGTIFGPRPRSYDIKVNKKVKQLAKRSALSAKVGKGEIRILEDFTFEAPRTKSILEIGKTLALTTKKVTYVLGSYDNNVYLSSRNLPTCSVVPLGQLNTYDIVNGGSIVLLESALAALSVI